MKGQRIRIAIDPRIKNIFGPEVCWSWEVLLAGIGLPWEEVSFDSQDCDILYTTSRQRQKGCRVQVHASPDLWNRRGAFRFRSIGSQNGWRYPLYEGESDASEFLLADSCLVCERDIIFDHFWLLTGQEETHLRKNKHGHLSLSGTPFQSLQVPRQALATELSFQMEKSLVALGFLPGIPRWPDHKRAAVCLSHDVDYPEVIRLLEPWFLLHREGIQCLGPAASLITGHRHHWHFESWVADEKRMGMKSAFYFVARKGSLLEYALGTPDPFYDIRSDRFRRLFDFLRKEGFEIGMQASYRAFEDRDRMAGEKRLLEEVTGHPILGNRHHYWHLNPQNPEATLLLHERLGLAYDASLSNERYAGWRRASTWPFFPFHQKERRSLKTLQLPTAWMDDHFFGHIKDNPGERDATTEELIRRVLRQGGCLMISIHEYVYDDVLFPGWAQAYRNFLEKVAASSDFWVATPSQLACHWSERHRQILGESHGLGIESRR